ncbi:hypothetical protein WT24_17300 [Burkholderia sp. MSMB1078WGS]|nr:hypothetical protein WT24_17300 [Burkholderia sp. MSMB1078WGS]
MRGEMALRYQASSASCTGQNRIGFARAYLSFPSRNARSTEEYKMHSENHIDLEIALRKIHELAMAEVIWATRIGTKPVGFYNEPLTCKQK